MIRALRTLAILIAVAAIVDPAFAVRRAQPPVVDIRAGTSAASDAQIQDVRQRILDAGVRTATASDGAPSAVVFVAPSPGALGDLPDGIPVSFVELDPVTDESIRIVRVTAPAAVLPGQTAVVSAELEAAGLEGRTSVVTLEQQGAELARVTVQWPGTGHSQIATLTYAPPVAGMHRLQVVAHPPVDIENRAAAAVDVALIAESRELRVMTYEPRPSWGAGFVRRAVESDPVFASAAFARASRGIEVRAGTAPERLTPAALEPFDAVVIGAPEALSAAEVEALDTFLRVRGGAVVLLPDRRPSGPYVGLLPVKGFDEVLIESPLALEGEAPHALKASELALPQDAGAAASTIASARLQDRVRPAIVSWPHGAGRLVFSGALDAWRFRADDDAAFARFWTGLLASLAASAPRPLSVTVHPALATPGEPVTVRAALRQTEWITAGERIELPPIGAAIVGANGTELPIRLWPAAEAGVFEGTVKVQESGRFDVRASVGPLTADTPLIVAGDVRTAAAPADARLAVVARATGGVSVRASDLGPLTDHLRALSPPDVTVTTRPMRSGWWMIPFAAALCAEWALRRRRGLH